MAATVPVVAVPVVAVVAKRSVAEGGYKKRGRSGERSLLPSLCARNINDNHFSPDTGANPRRALCNTDRARRGPFSFSSRDLPRLTVQTNPANCRRAATCDEGRAEFDKKILFPKCAKKKKRCADRERTVVSFRVKGNNANENEHLSVAA
jgi:hypothetical protein